jgi:reversibly glycosylated polypeptide/UDP-arabinopyranose mutase
MARDASDVQLSEVDVVVVALQPSLSFLAPWRELLQGCHVIVVQGEDFPGVIRVPEGFENVDVYTRATMARVLGPELLRALPFTGNGSRGFGYLVARRRYVFTMEPGCVPAEDPEGYVVNPVVEHVLNLKTPATPFFFNTLYDPFREWADFVRGYPFSLREGVPTAISQGAWTSSSAARYVDAVLTVPKFVLYTASGINLAFDRHLVGPLMFEPPELGFGGELWAGLCAKTVCDYFPWGVKTGLPYVCRSEKAAALADDARTDRFDVIAQFFQATELSGNPVDVAGCYLEIAEQAKSKLSAVDPVFKEVASSMQAWIQAWNKLGH